MRYVQFEVVEDENYGDAGILPNIHRNWVNFNPASAVTSLAHDILEHGCRETGAFHEEIAAIGSYFFTRLLTGHVTIYNAAEKLATNGMAMQWKESSVDYIPEPPKIFFLSPEENEMLDDFLSGVRRELAREWSTEIERGYDAKENHKCPYTSKTEWPKMVNWYKYGYARAKRRYHGDDDLAYRLYSGVGRVIEKHWNELSDYCDSGRKFTLALDLQTGDVELRGLNW